jgi:hypothetical protein
MTHLTTCKVGDEVAVAELDDAVGTVEYVGPMTVGTLFYPRCVVVDLDGVRAFLEGPTWH